MLELFLISATKLTPDGGRITCELVIQVDSDTGHLSPSVGVMQESSEFDRRALTDTITA